MMGYLSFLEVKKYANADTTGMKKYRMSVVGDCATQHICIALRGVAAQMQIALEVYEADYNQIELQLYDGASSTYAAAPNAILLFMCTEMLYETFCQMPPEYRKFFAQEQYSRISSYWEAVKRNSTAIVLQTLFMEYDDRVFGSYGNKTEQSFLFQLRKLNYLLMEGISTSKYVYPVDLQYVRDMLSNEQLLDPKMYYAVKMPYVLNALPTIAQQVMQVVNAHIGRTKKCIILDLDNTLWGGVVGDDGWDGIQIGDLGTGRAFSSFQKWLRLLKQRGILLAVCSKNEEATAKEPFEKNPEMVLHLEDISLFVANWQNKAQNVFEMQKILNIGMDSIVFLDDNPFERETVRQLVPDITVPELPKDPALYVSYLESLNLFETVSFSEEDAHRTDQYRSEARREKSRKMFASFDEYLTSLDMKAEAKPFDSYHFPRIAQLSQRSNQFNLRTVRYSEEDVARMAKDDHYITIYYTLEDKFGKYGLIGVVIMEKKDAETLFVDTWFMSCRVLKRGMEEFIINHAVEEAQKEGFRRIIGEYIPTQKNTMVKSIYPAVGFCATGRKNTYELDVGRFIKLPTHIEEV